MAGPTPIEQALQDLGFWLGRESWKRGTRGGELLHQGRWYNFVPGFEACPLNATHCGLSSGDHRYAVVDSEQLQRIVEAEETTGRLWEEAEKQMPPT